MTERDARRMAGCELCKAPPRGWEYSREADHDGPCAARPTRPTSRDTTIEALTEGEMYGLTFLCLMCVVLTSLCGALVGVLGFILIMLYAIGCTLDKIRILLRSQTL